VEGDRYFLVSTKIIFSSVFPHLLPTWIWMLAQAKIAHRPEGQGRKLLITRGTKTIEYELQPGEFSMTYKQMGEALDCNPSTALRRTKKLVEIGNIATKRGTKFTIVTINNWPDYQPEWKKGATTRATRAQRGRNDSATPAQHLREREKGRKGSKSSSNGFDQFWTEYPKKVGKQAALRAWKNKKPPLDLVLKAISWQRNSKEWKKDNGEYIPHPATWINAGRWEDQPQSQGGGYRW
jgi:hypothetical protein